MKQLDKWQWSTLILSAILVMAFSVFIYRYEPFKSGFEITDQLGGNIFPATILSTATTDANLIVPADSDYIGNPKSCIAIRLKNSYANSKLRIEVAETPFFLSVCIRVYFTQGGERISGFSGYYMELSGFA